jgi:TRAP-type C4-dicarboxylate transport system permease small subunit
VKTHKKNPGLLEAFIRAVDWLTRVSGAVAAGLIALGVLVICDVVVERYLLNRTTIWQIDVVTYCIVSATFIGSAYVLKTRGHVNVDVLPLHLGPRARYWLALSTMLVAIGFCVVILVLGSAYWHQAWANNWRSDTVWRARLWIPLGAMPIGLGLVVLQYVVELIFLLTGRTPPFGIGDERTHS